MTLTYVVIKKSDMEGEAFDTLDEALRFLQGRFKTDYLLSMVLDDLPVNQSLLENDIRSAVDRLKVRKSQ